MSRMCDVIVKEERDAQNEGEMTPFASEDDAAGGVALHSLLINTHTDENVNPA